MLSLSKENLWGFSLPIGSESIRIVQLIKHLSECIYDYQRLNYISSKDYEYDGEFGYEQVVKSQSKQSSPSKNTINLPPFATIEVRYTYISMNNIFLRTYGQKTTDMF